MDEKELEQLWHQAEAEGYAKQARAAEEEILAIIKL
jgi:hypothetical protein